MAEATVPGGIAQDLGQGLRQEELLQLQRAVRQDVQELPARADNPGRAARRPAAHLARRPQVQHPVLQRGRALRHVRHHVPARHPLLRGQDPRLRILAFPQLPRRRI